MKDVHPIVKKWFDCWNTGNIDDLPIAEDFRHTSPFGTIASKQRYLEIVNKNKADFLSNTLTLINHLAQGNEVCVQFEQQNSNTGLEMTVCEWYVIQGRLIKEIRSFYNVGNASIRA